MLCYNVYNTLIRTGDADMLKADVGLIGLAVMGQNLALNIEGKGFKICVYNRTTSTTTDFMEGAAKGKIGLSASYSFNELVASLKTPRKIILMVKAGEAVDELINILTPLLYKGDILIDGGNSFFKDTIRRTRDLQLKGIDFMGVGISGGEEGALNGPSIMPGGSNKAWESVSELLTAISAKASDGLPCCAYLGPDGAGHFVKMVHNGIEYADMQLISEAYFLLRELIKMQPLEIGEVFRLWNEGELNSYLIEITANILARTDPETGKAMVDVILDKAGQKGTGMWTSSEALELGAASPTIAEAVFARYMSSMKDERVKAAKILHKTDYNIFEEYVLQVDDIKKALFATKIISYAQGFDILKKGSARYSWGFDLGEIALLWRSGCIIRAKFLERIKEAYRLDKNLPNLLLDPYFIDSIKNSLDSLRKVIALAAKAGLPIPAFYSALAYFDSYRCETLPANLIQAQRDYFGAHTYERVDKSGIFHTDWD